MDNFVVRVWTRSDDVTATGKLRGVVRHVATGTETPFHSDEEVLRLLHHPPTGHLPQPARGPLSAGRQPPDELPGP